LSKITRLATRAGGSPALSPNPRTLLVGPGDIPAGPGKFVLRLHGVGVFKSQHALPDGQDLLVQCDRLGDPADRAIGLARSFRDPKVLG
jgi:hypothetical protein